MHFKSFFPVDNSYMVIHILLISENFYMIPVLYPHETSSPFLISPHSNIEKNLVMLYTITYTEILCEIRNGAML